MTIEYYQNNAKKFVEGTLNVDVSELCDRFLKYVPSGGSILDAGCGSGRDVKFFSEAGYSVTAIDASSEIARIATEYSGVEVQCMKFEDIEFQDEFDGVWACSSLLHVSQEGLNDVLQRLSNSLKENGIMYVSFKYGDDESVRGGRLFNDLTEESFSTIIDGISDLAIVEMWKTEDLRPNREGEFWLNALVKRHDQL